MLDEEEAYEQWADKMQCFLFSNYGFTDRHSGKLLSSSPLHTLASDLSSLRSDYHHPSYLSQRRPNAYEEAKDPC